MRFSTYETADHPDAETADAPMERRRGGVPIRGGLLRMEIKHIKAGGVPCRKCGAESRHAHGTPDALFGLCDRCHEDGNLNRRIELQRLERDSYRRNRR